MLHTPWLVFVLIVGLAALLVAWWLARYVLRQPCGTDEMQGIAAAIKQGAEAFLRRQYFTIAWLSVLVGGILYLLYWQVKKDPTAGAYATVAFFLGAVCSGLAGFIGMFVSIRANIRTADASRRSLNDALKISFRGGAVSGITVVAMSLLGVGGLYAVYRFSGSHEIQEIPHLLIGYGFGASFVALFAQLGGGIYTKGADVGADLVGKVVAGIPEDDPRNPAVIADLVGDNVGDCAGRGADLFESTAAENIGAMILGIALYNLELGPGQGHLEEAAILFPLVARALGLVASIIAVFFVHTREEHDPMRALNRGYFVSCVLAALGFFIATQFLLQGSLWFFACGLVGIVTSILFVFITQYYTEYKYPPVRAIARASETGSATNIITGMAVALECTALPVIVISAAIWISYELGQHALPNTPGAGFFGTAVATMGMLSTCAYILSMDTFGPITDNAGGIVEMSRQPVEVRQRTDRLDSVGNTTKALTKGYAIGTAALAAFLLFSAYLDEVTALLRKADPNAALRTVDIAKPEVFIGAMIGAMLIFLFSSLAIRAVGRAAYYIINDVRRQFLRPGVLEGKVTPDYATCVDIATKGALKEMVLPGIVAVAVPVLVGWILKAEAAAALLMVGTIAGILVATMMNNGGGAWDNAKKWIETGQYGGKGSDAHKAAVIGDTVGDPFKDTAGPSIHVLIKLLSTVTLVLAPLFIG
jgi:K(+)-stimulated pyrophosphate-energized sodium pump